MANTTFNTRISLKYDTYTNWMTNDPVILKGEAAVCVIPPSTGAVTQEPAVMIKIGDGVKKFSELGWLSGLSADIYDWARAEKKPVYQAEEIQGIGTYIADYVDAELGISVDTDHEYKLNKINDRQYKLMGKAKGDKDYTLDCGTIDIPDTVYTLATGSANGTVSFNGKDVAVKGLGSAAYTNSTAYDEAGAADAVQGNLDKLSGKVGTVPDGKTVVGMISDADGKISTLVGSDSDKSVRVIANEELVKQLIPEGAKESLDTLTEIAAWIQSHPDDAATMNEQIEANAGAISKLNGAETADGSVKKIAKGYADTVQGNLTSHIGDKVSHVTAAERTTWNGKTTMADVEAKGYQTAADVTNAINKLDVEDYEVTNHVVSAVSEVDGKIQVTRRHVTINELDQLGYIIFDCGASNSNI